MRDGQFRAFRQDVELAIGHHGGNFQDAIGLRVQPGHFQVDPNQAVLRQIGSHRHAHE